MCSYSYAYHLVSDGGEIFFKFPSFENIITSIDKKSFTAMSANEIDAFASDAVITALQGLMSFGDDIPDGEDMRRVKSDGFVSLKVIAAMKLQLYDVYRANFSKVSELANFLGKPPTAASRLLNLRHNSNAAEIETAIGAFGKRLVHDWTLEAA